MRIRIVQFCAVILTALALMPGGAHLLALQNKIGMDRESYFVAQQIYRGWAPLGIVLILAMLANAWLAWLSRRQRLPSLGAGAAAVLLALTLAIFFAWTYPANQATAEWTQLPDGWEVLRAQWEYSHAANALIAFLALCAATASGLAWRDRSS